MITEADRFRREQREEESLRFRWEASRYRRNRALKKIAREFPDLRSDELESLYLLERLSENLLVSADKINRISDFSPSYGSEFEANLIVNETPFADFLSVQTEKLEEDMDREVETFARSENIRRTGFIPTDFDYITGWTAFEVLVAKEQAEMKTAQELDLKVTDLSFNEVEEFVAQNPQLFAEDTRQALRLYRYVVLKNLTKIVVDSLRQMLEDLLLVSGSAKFSDIALTLGLQLNLDNRKSLETAVDAERNVLNFVGRTARGFRAIFPQLR